VQEDIVLQVRLEALQQETPQRAELHVARKGVNHQDIPAAKLDLTDRHLPALTQTITQRSAKSCTLPAKESTTSRSPPRSLILLTGHSLN
jgi:hypothetical protein